MTPVDWLRSAADRSPDAPALAAGDRVVSYAELDRAADAVAAALDGSGVGTGSRVALWGTPLPRTVAALWGIPRAGCTAVPLTPGLPAMRAARLTAAAGTTVLWDRPDDELGPPRPAGTGPGDWGPPDPEARFVVFTSGSTAEPKGVPITGSMIEASVEASRDRLGNGPRDRWLCAVPLSHVAGLSILWRQAREAAPVVLERWFDAGRTAALLADGTVTLASLVPTMLQRVLDAGPDRYSGVRAVLVGGGPVPVSSLERALDAGLPALQTYGLTETLGQVATVAPGEAAARLGTAGRALPGVEIRTVADDGSVAPAGAAGRIEVRGPVVMSGYLGEEGRRTPDEWFRTADLGVLDTDGYLTVLGRADEVVVTGGENVHPAQVEAVIRGLDGVVDVSVFGDDDPEWGRVVCADVVLEGDLLEEVAARTRAALPGFMAPKRWRRVERIERGWKG
jgi:O-succinylbenzoic acid--CoA ligase